MQETIDILKKSYPEPVKLPPKVPIVQKNIEVESLKEEVRHWSSTLTGMKNNVSSLV